MAAMSKEETMADIWSHENCSIRSCSVEDADELASRSSRWNVVYEQVTPGRFKGSAEEIWIGPIQLFDERANQSLLESGGSWKDSRTFGVFNSCNEAEQCSGSSVDAGYLCTLSSNQGLIVRTPRSFRLVSATVDTGILEEYSTSVEKVSLEEKLRNTWVISSDAATCAKFQGFLISVHEAIRTSPELLESKQARNSIIDSILSEILRVALINEKDDQYVLPGNTRRRVVSRACEYIREHIDEPIAVSDLCRKVNVSRRTLQYSFQAVLGINPVAYLRMLRLNGARRDLRRIDPAPGYVTEVAQNWGFWHFSRFAMHYRQMFGERPSETCERRASPCEPDPVPLPIGNQNPWQVNNRALRDVAETG